VEQITTVQVEGAKRNKEIKKIISNRSLSPPRHQKCAVTKIKELLSDRLTHSQPLKHVKI
jgi:hypothetical protein